MSALRIRITKEYPDDTKPWRVSGYCDGRWLGGICVETHEVAIGCAVDWLEDHAKRQAKR